MSAAVLRDLHRPGDPLLLPNAWDADTARLVEGAGFPVVATSSVGVAAALGYDDGHAPAAEMLAAAARIVRAVSVPVSVDAESGYGLEPAELVERLLEVGAAGCNLEDTDQRTGARRSASEQADLLGRFRAAAGDALVLNARVDSFLGGKDVEQALPDAVERATAYLAAGADCVFPIHLRSADVLTSFVRAVSPAAVNATLMSGGPDLATLRQIGVARVSLGGGLWTIARGAVAARLAELMSLTPDPNPRDGTNPTS